MKFKEITYLRVIATFLVVLFHSYAPFLYHLDYFTIPIPKTLISNSYKFIFDTEELLQMPLFAFISGFLLSSKNKFTFNYLIRNKVKRLILPYFLFAFLMYFSLNNDSNQVRLLFLGRYYHLWFLTALFFCFLFFFLFHKLNAVFLFFISLVLYFISSVSLFPQLLGPASALFIYFIIGYYLFQKRHMLYKLDIWKVLFILSISELIFYALRFYTNNGFIDVRVFSRLRLLFSIIIVLSSIRFISNIKRTPNKIIVFLDKYSMGIYIYHCWIFIGICQHRFIQNLYLNHSIIMPIVMFFFLSSTSVICTFVTKKIPYIKQLI